MTTVEMLTRTELHDAGPTFSPQERLEGFRLSPRSRAEDLFAALDTHDQLELLEATDPSAAAPFVATLVDVTGLVIYLTVASVILHGTLL